MSNSKRIKLYAIFHLNLAFSSIDRSSHATVVERCYWPLLNLAENHNIPIGIELTAHTLEMINSVSPQWVEKFSELLERNKCELLASGDSQIIGPLVPADINNHNLRLGLLAYKKFLGTRPRLAYINEQAVSPGLLDIYYDQGFDAVVIEWDNPYAYNPSWPNTLLHQPQRLATNSGKSIPVIWNNAIAFQKFQRFVHGELTQQDYLDYLSAACANGNLTFSIYGNDAEVFDFRPGRYKEEHAQQTHEWEKIQTLFKHLASEDKYEWVLPNEVLKEISEEAPLSIFSAEHAISVKKQAKYNITRWGLSGRNDLALNTLAFKQYKHLHTSKSANDVDWTELCRLWASDLRTHLTQERYNAIEKSITENIGETVSELENNTTFQTIPETETLNVGEFQITRDLDRQRVSVSSPHIQARFNMRRGLSIESLSFSQHNFEPIFGTLPHGYFDHIKYAADFYSNHLVMERFRERDRVTDLNPASVTMQLDGDILSLRGVIDSPFGEITKCYKFEGESLTCAFSFEESVRPEASLRLGFLTFLNTKKRFWYACHNGGLKLEKHDVEYNFDHGLPVSSIVSAASALGATEGEFILGNDQYSALISWDPSSCAALPMLSSKSIHDHYLNRFWFSLVECDETLQSGGKLLPFHFSIQPSRLL